MEYEIYNMIRLFFSWLGLFFSLSSFVNFSFEVVHAEFISIFDLKFHGQVLEK